MDCFWGHYRLAELFFDEGKFDDTYTHIESAKLHTLNSMYNLGLAVELLAVVWFKKHRFEEARSEVLCAADVYEKLGAAMGVESCRKLLQITEETQYSIAIYERIMAAKDAEDCREILRDVEEALCATSVYDKPGTAGGVQRHAESSTRRCGGS